MPDDAAGVDVNDVFRDVGGVVGDALQVFGDHDVAEFRVGLLAVGFHQADHVLHDLVIESIDDIVALEDVTGEILIAKISCLDRVAKRRQHGVGHEL